MERKWFKIRRLACVCLLALFSLSLVSCGEEAEGYTVVGEEYRNDNPCAVALILGNHANAKAVPQDAYGVVEKYLDNVVYGGYLCVIVADATPTKVEVADDVSFFEENAKNPSILAQRIKERKKELLDRLKNTDYEADAQEVDLLAAVREAKNALSNSRLDAVSDKRIIIVDTGISTSGDLNFVDMDFQYSKPDIQSIVEQLGSYEGSGVLPDLKGITVTFVGTQEGLAEVAEPQKATVTDKKFIKDLWTGVMQACGADAVQFEIVAGWDADNVYTEDSDSKFPYVSVISFFHKPVIEFPDLGLYNSDGPDSPPNLPEPPVVEVELPSAEIGFKPDRADYLNGLNTLNMLRPYADELATYFKYYPEERIWIVGTTASTRKNGEGSVDLSLRRAETVKNTLVAEFGIPDENLLTLGLGAKFPWAVDTHPNGEFDTVIAQANRAVWLLTEDSEMFQRIRSAYTDGELLSEVILRFEQLNTDTVD